ncbi:hypothetical protein VTO42DRAFT_9011 [Malbranchea cinnamomea]
MDRTPPRTVTRAIARRMARMGEEETPVRSSGSRPPRTPVDDDPTPSEDLTQAPENVQVNQNQEIIQEAVQQAMQQFMQLMLNNFQPRSKESTQSQDEDAWNQHNEPEGPDEFGPNSDDDDELAELFGFELDPNSRAGQAVATFREKVKLVKRPIALTGTASYLSWKQSILQGARQAGIDYILTKKQVRPPSDRYDAKAVWNEYNSWLYGFMWTSISTQALSHFKSPDENIAYNLWEILEITFAERPQTTRHRLLQELNFMTSKSMGGD